MPQGFKHYGGDKAIRRVDGRVCAIWMRSDDGNYLTICNQWAEDRNLTTDPANCPYCEKKEK